MKKRILFIALCCSILITSASIGVNAPENSVITYTSECSDYAAEKLSHPNKDVKTADGLVDYVGNGVVSDQLSEDSVGDRAQNYSWSAVGYGDYMYIGTCANAMTNTLSFMKSALGNNYDEETMKATLNAMYNGHFYIEEDGGNPNGILVKLNTKTGEVKLLMSKATTGTNCLFRNAVEYNGMLYFCGSVSGIPSIYQVNPENDEIKCVYQSMTVQENIQAFKEGISVGIRGMCVFQDKLIVSLINLDGAYICATDDPTNPDSFEVVADMDNLFNYPAYHYYDSIYGGSIWDMIEYNNSLYVTICTGTPDNKPDSNTMQSFALVRADIDENGEWNWTSVAGDTETCNSKYTYGIDPERTRSGAANLMVFGDYLYIGEYNDEEIALEDVLFSMNCNFVNANLEQSVNLYRMDENEDIELVVGDADEMFPEGSLTGYGSGFDRNENQYIWRMEVYNDKLYIGTFDTSSLLEPIGQFTNGDLINMSAEEWESQINYLKELIDIMKSKNENTDEEITTSDIDSSLTDEQIEAAVEFANNDSVSSMIDTSTIQEAIELYKQLKEIKDMISENTSEEFLQAYSERYTELSAVLPELPELLQTELSSLISEDTLESIKSFLVCGGYMSTADRGFDLYVFDSDMNVETVTTNGFGDPYNHGCRVFAITNQGLNIGTANPFYGTQVWNLTDTSVGPTEPETEPTEPEYELYDVNRDGVVNIMDSTYIQKVTVDLISTPEGIEIYGDLNGDGQFNIMDATFLQKHLAS